MICRGNVPVWHGKITKDARNFLRYLLPSGTRPDAPALGKACRHLHLAFKGMETEEIYDVLVEQFLRAAAKYDPRYGEKLQQIVEVIENALSKRGGFHAADVRRHVDFDCHRYLRLLCRRGFLTCQAQGNGSQAVYQRSGTGPTAAECFRKPAGITDRLPAGFAQLPLGPDRHRRTPRV